MANPHTSLSLLITNFYNSQLRTQGSDAERLLAQAGHTPISVDGEHGAVEACLCVWVNDEVRLTELT